jgi:hypothetical protein
MCEAAGWGGLEEHLITIIAATANTVTIADFLYKYFRKTKRKKKAIRRYFVAHVSDEEEIILNDLTKQEIIKIIETHSKYSLLFGPAQENLRKAKRLRKKRRAKVKRF